MDIGIRLQNISLEYPVYNHSSLFLKSALISLASSGAISRFGNNAVKVRAINNLNLHLTPGDRLGIIGGNGAGKTSLLKLLAGIYEQSEGMREINGSVTTILGTGFGLDEEATGYQNILLGGIALGYRLKELKAAYPDIMEFTELGDYLNMPLRTYSTGMRARLAYAIATAMKPNILLIDEGIGAGDTKFLKKANQRLEKFLQDASILVIASHDDDLLRRFCNKVLYMHHGQARFFGPLEEGLALYHKDMEAPV